MLDYPEPFAAYLTKRQHVHDTDEVALLWVRVHVEARKLPAWDFLKNVGTLGRKRGLERDSGVPC